MTTSPRLLIPARETAEIAVDLEIAAGLGTKVVMQAAVGVPIQPDARQKFKLLISRNSLLHEEQPFRRDVPDKFLTWLKWRNRGPTTAGRTMIAGFDDRQ